MMRVLVCGDRNWNDQEHHHLISAVLDGLYTEHTVGYLTVDMETLTIIDGDARGADRTAGWWAINSPMHAHPEDAENYAPVFHECYPAKWDEHGKAAGPIRNQQMLDEGKPDVVIAFHDDLASSKGTADMVRRAKKADVPVYVIGRG